MLIYVLASQVALVVMNWPGNAGDIRDQGSILGSGRSPGGGHGNPLKYSCLENPMERAAWQAMVHRVVKNWTNTCTIYDTCTSMGIFYNYSNKNDFKLKKTLSNTC